MDRLEAMAILVEAVDVGSLSAARRKMNVPLPTVSRKTADFAAAAGSMVDTRHDRNPAVVTAAASRLIVSFGPNLLTQAINPSVSWHASYPRRRYPRAVLRAPMACPM